MNLSSGPFFRWHIAYAKERYRPYFENYTVDASILYSSLYWLVVFKIIKGTNLLVTQIDHWSISFIRDRFKTHVIFKFIRANSGCLGIWSRRRT
jgi:hypothetical protein